MVAFALVGLMLSVISGIPRNLVDKRETNQKEYFSPSREHPEFNRRLGIVYATEKNSIWATKVGQK
jgi:hypothetical protein